MTKPRLNELLLFRRRGVVPTVLLVDTVINAGAKERMPDERGPMTDAHALAYRLSELGIQCYVTPPELFRLPDEESGHLGEWILKVLPTGRVIPVNQPQASNWRPLA